MGLARAVGYSTVCPALLCSSFMKHHRMISVEWLAAASVVKGGATPPLQFQQMSSAKWLAVTPTANLGAVEWEGAEIAIEGMPTTSRLGQRASG